MNNTKTPNYVKHPTSLVETENIGRGTRVWAFSHILAGANIGENCNICDHTFIEALVTIGNNVTIKSGVWLWDGITIENNVFIGPNATFTNDLHPRSGNRNFNQQKTLLKEGSSIGAGAVVLAGLTIGEYAMVGAGSVVTKNIGSYELWFGNPATLKGYVCECGESLIQNDNIHFKCQCGKSYKKQDVSEAIIPA